MRSILEEAFEHLLNGDEDTATSLIHEFMVGKARQIHESLRCEDEVIDEEYFVEDDVDPTDDESLGTDVVAQDDGEEVSADDAEDTLSDDLGTEGGEEEGEEKDEFDLADIEDHLEQIVAQLEAHLNDENGEEGSEDENFEDHEDANAVQDDMEDGQGEEGSVEEEPSEDDFDDVTESVLDELKKISVEIEDGKEVGAGGKVPGGKKPSVIPGSTLRDKSKPEPVVSGKGATHKGYDLEIPKTKPTTMSVDRKSTSGAVDARKKKDAKLSPVVPPKGTLLSTKP